MNCTGCPALHYPLSSGVCAMGYRTATTTKDGYRVRHPLETCHRPSSDGEVADRIEEIARERSE